VVSEVLNWYYLSCESKEIYGDHPDPLLSPRSVTGKLKKSSPIEAATCKFEVGSPCSSTAFFRSQTKRVTNGLATYVETLVYSRRKTCVKRKLNFDVGGDNTVVNKRISTSFDFKNA
jgi:hypothetical protein